MCLLVLHYISELIHHIGQLIQTVDKDEKFTQGKLNNPRFDLLYSAKIFVATRLISGTILVLARLSSVIVAVVTLWFGLASGDQHELDIQAGYYNTPSIRLAVLGGILVLQV